VGPGSVWTCAKNLAPTGIRSPDRPARSQSLYRLSYPAHGKHIKDLIKYDDKETYNCGNSGNGRLQITNRPFGYEAL
jgi:hypothetical protein